MNIVIVILKKLKILSSIASDIKKENNMESILECKNICKSFGKKKILENVSLEVAPGDILGFIGPNGSGKTTTIKLILGLQKIDSGTIFINGYDVTKKFCKAIAKVGAIVENPDFYMSLTGWQNLMLVANNYSSITKEHVKEIVKFVGLENRIHDKVSKYSLGMKERLGIARALINNPNLLILDEPTNGLDPEGIKELRDLLKRLAQEGIGVLISSHNLSELESFCNKVCIINSGRVIETSEVSAIKHNDGRVIFKVSDTTALPIKDASDIKKNSFVVNVSKEQIPAIVRKLVKSKIDIYEIKMEEVSLEEAFLKKTRGKK